MNALLYLALALTLAALALRALPRARALLAWLRRPTPYKVALALAFGLLLSYEEMHRAAEATGAAVVVFSRVLRRREDGADTDGDGFDGLTVSPTYVEGPTLRPRDAAGDCRRSVSRARALAPDRVAVAKRMHRVPALSYNAAP